jgi:Type III secretion basal body protein I, YscI, HrpB, PscI
MTDIASLSQGVAQTIKEQASSGAGGGTASAEDVSKFQSAMTQPEPGKAAGNDAALPEVKGVAAADNAEKSPGQKILDYLGDYQKQSKDLSETVSKAGDSPADLLKVQMHVMQHSMQTEMMSKVVASVNKITESLLKSG